MKNIIITLSVMLTFNLQAQINLIPNPGFEEAQPGKTPVCLYDMSNFIDQDIAWWKRATCFSLCNTYKRSTPDWRNPGFYCTTNPFATSRHIYIEELITPRFRDAIRVGLFSTMNPSKNYTFKINYASGKRESNADPSIILPRVTIHLTKYGAHWSSFWGNTRLSFPMYPPFRLDLNHAPNNANQNDWEQHWHVLNGPLLNSQPYFGNIFNDLKNIVLDCSGNHAYIDYVELAENCASPLLIENHQFYNNIDEIPYKAGSILKAGYDVGNPLPNGNVIVNSGANVIFKAADQIILEPGFVAEQGSNFQTIIEPCNINTAREDNTITIIDDKTIQIGDITIYDDRVETLACNDTLRIYGLDGDITSFINYFWDFGNGQTSDNPIGEVFYETPGEYTVTLALTDSLNVTDTLSKIYIQPDCNRKSSATNSTNNENNYVSNVTPVIFPNPTSGNFTITQLEQFAGGNIAITNLMGQVVLEQKINSSTLNINLANQPKGIYLVKVNSEKESVVQKVVVE